MPALFVPLEITDKTPAESWMIQRGHTVFRITGQTKDGRGGTDGRIDNPREKKRKKKKKKTTPTNGRHLLEVITPASVGEKKKKGNRCLPASPDMPEV